MIKELVEHVVKSIVEKPEQVTVSVTTEQDTSVLEIQVDEADRGKVIGREGQTIKAIRALVGVIAPSGKKVKVDIASR